MRTKPRKVYIKQKIKLLLLNLNIVSYSGKDIGKYVK